MGKRRPSGDGMVRKREDGRWEGRIVVGHKENGDSIFRYMSAGSQKALTEKLHREMSTYRGVDLTEDSRMMQTAISSPMFSMMKAWGRFCMKTRCSRKRSSACWTPPNRAAAIVGVFWRSLGKNIARPSAVYLPAAAIWNQAERRLRKCIGLVRWLTLTGQVPRWCWK